MWIHTWQESHLTFLNLCLELRRRAQKIAIAVIKGFKHELTRPSLAIYNPHTYSDVQLCNYPFKELFIYRCMIDVKALHIIIPLLMVYIFNPQNCQYTASAFLSLWGPNVRFKFLLLQGDSELHSGDGGAPDMKLHFFFCGSRVHL